MSITATSKWLFLVTGFYAVACAPGILIADHFSWPQSLFHRTQFIAALLCLPACLVFLWNTRGSRFGGQRWLAAVGASLCSLWLAFIAYVALTLDFSGID